jgi:hypothetical protein
MFVISSCNLRSSLSVADAHLVFTSCEFCPQKSRGTAAISRCRVGDAAMRGRCQIVYAMQHLIDEHTIAAPQH